MRRFPRLRKPLHATDTQGERWMTNNHSDAFVFFGATGDLAWKQIFPALQGLIRQEGFNMPIHLKRSQRSVVVECQRAVSARTQPLEEGPKLKMWLYLLHLFLL